MSAAPDRDISFAVLEFNPDPAARQVDQLKAEATAAARAALAAQELVKLADGSFIGCKPAWAMFVHLKDIEAVESWLKRVGAPA